MLNRYNTKGHINYQFRNTLDRPKQLLLFRSLLQSTPSAAHTILDFVVQEKVTRNNSTILLVPRIEDVNGAAFIEHRDIYRILLDDKKYIDSDGNVRELSSDFVIREGQSVYAHDKTTLLVYSRGIEKKVELDPGEGMRFTTDSGIAVQK